MIRFWTSFLAALVLCLGAIAASGWAASWLLTRPPPKRFLAANFEFQLPPRWACVQDQSEWVCRSRDKDQDAREAAIILTMKWRGPQDTLDAYIDHLKTPRKLTMRDGNEVDSDVRGVEKRAIGPHTWAIGEHLNSEIPYYITRYFATVTSHLGILITASAHQQAIARYEADFESVVRSLTIYQSRRPGSGK